MTTAITSEASAVSDVFGPWAPIRHFSNWRVVAEPGPHARYHRGSNGAIRIYRDEEPAQRRADILNGLRNDDGHDDGLEATR